MFLYLTRWHRYFGIDCSLHLLNIKFLKSHLIDYNYQVLSGTYERFDTSILSSLLSRRKYF